MIKHIFKIGRFACTRMHSQVRCNIKIEKKKNSEWSIINNPEISLQRTKLYVIKKLLKCKCYTSGLS